MSLPSPLLEAVASPFGVTAAAVLGPLVLASLVYLDASRRNGAPGARGRSLTPLAWGATTFFSGVGCIVVVACYVAVNVVTGRSAPLGG